RPRPAHRALPGDRRRQPGEPLRPGSGHLHRRLRAQQLGPDPRVPGNGGPRAGADTVTPAAAHFARRRRGHPRRGEPGLPPPAPRGRRRVKLVSLEVFPTRLPMRETFRIARGAVGDPAVGAPHIYVRLTADDGGVGWGEARPSPRWSYET